MSEPARVPTSEAQSKGVSGGWSLETTIDYLLSVVNEKHQHVLTLVHERYSHVVMLVAGNDKRYEERFAASQKALEIGLIGTKNEISVALAASKEAVLKAEAATNERFKAVNEFRGSLDDQQRTLIPRTEVVVMIKGLEEKLAGVTKLMDEMRNRERVTDGNHKGLRDGWALAVGVAGFVLALVTIIWRLNTP